MDFFILCSIFPQVTHILTERVSVLKIQYFSCCNKHILHQTTDFNICKKNIWKSWIFQRCVFFQLNTTSVNQVGVLIKICKSCGSLRRVSAYQYKSGMDANNTGITTIQNYYQPFLLPYLSGTGGTLKNGPNANFLIKISIIISLSWQKKGTLK